MSYYKTKCKNLGDITTDDVTRSADGSPYLILSQRIIFEVNRGVIVLLDCKEDPMLSGFINAHPNASSWHRDISNGIACLYKPQGIIRETGTDFVTIDEDKHAVYDSNIYQIDPPINTILTVDYGDPTGKIVFWTNRSYMEVVEGMNVSKRVLHRRSQLSSPTLGSRVGTQNPLLFYGTFADKDGQKLFINSDF